MQQEELIKLGNRIKQLRKNKKLTLSALCYRNGLEPSTVSRIEAGVVEAKYLTLIKLANAFDLELYELLNFNCK
ncbi:helix-turn-helix transcriptional regulator [bacterium]|nr:helix-turn-helix transcriptional regulator [bacterium]